MPKEYYICRCTVDTCPRPTGGAFRKLVYNSHLWLLRPSETPFTCPDCGMQLIPLPPLAPGEREILRKRPFRPFGRIEEPDNVLLPENPFQKDTTRYQYPCFCTPDTVSDAAACATGGWYGGMRYWWLTPSNEPFTCPDCGDSFVPFPLTVTGEKDTSLRRPLWNDTKQET